MLPYDEVLQMDTALAETTLKTVNADNGAVVPQNPTKGKFTHFTADNIDINDSTIDGQNTFHATKVAGWQCGLEADVELRNIAPSKMFL